MTAKYEWDTDYEYEAQIAREAARWELAAEHQHKEDSARALAEAERAVIEAARAVQQGVATEWDDGAWGRKLQDLCLSVRALDALEEK